MKKIIVFILIVLVGILCRETLLSSYAKLFEKEILKEPLEGVFEENKFLFSQVKKQGFHQKYNGVLIMGGNPLIRLNGAIALYQNEIVEKIYITQPKNHLQTYNGLLQSEFEKLSLVLKFLEIPFEIVQNPRNGATSTLEEAKDFAKFAKDKQLKEILILTDSYHTRRTYATFQNEFKKDKLKTKLYIIGVPNPYYNAENWWKTELGLRTYIVETGTILAHWFRAFENVKEY